MKTSIIVSDKHFRQEIKVPAFTSRPQHTLFPHDITSALLSSSKILNITNKLPSLGTWKTKINRTQLGKLVINVICKGEISSAIR